MFSDINHWCIEFNIQEESSGVEQSDQMAKLFSQYLAKYKKWHISKSMNICKIRFKILPKLLNPQKFSNTLKI